MNAINRINLENIRCFAARQKKDISLPRIAILVGENSTGKSTFMACCSALAELSCYERIKYDPFNVAPFDMGTFKTIARHGSDSFTLAGRIGGLDLSYQFVNEHSKPSESAAAIQAGNVPELKFERASSGEPWHLTGPSYNFHLNAGEVSQRQFSQWLTLSVQRGVYPYGWDLEAIEQRAMPPHGQISQIPRLLNHLAQISENLLRSKPVVHAVSPHIDAPARLYGEVPLAESMDEFDQMRDHLREAGDKLGLFSQINIASTPSGAYSLEVTVHDRALSIVDAGFGLHSVLPCLKAVVKNSDSTVLMQQPETHLHPMAQALLSQLIAESKGRYIIETHADHIIKRLSICIRKKEISPADATIFWFEENGGSGTTIHPIGFDEIGNLTDAPPNYRKFFIRERKEFLGFE